MVIKYIRKLLGGRKKAKAEEAREAKATVAARDRRPAIHHRPIPINLIDPEAAKIIARLRRFGHTAYIVGGGVRDLLLDRTPKDFDIGTSARPNEVRKLFRNCRIIGRRFRLAHIFFHDKIIEVATYRSNEPEDVAAAVEAGTAQLPPRRDRGKGRRDPGAQAAKDTFIPEEGDLLIRSDNVFGTPETDALRRDFTINALFYDIESGNVIDYVGGIPDLDAHVLRTIGDPDIRLREDPIRILRAIRLAGRLEFTIDPATLEAIRRHKGEIARAAPPRVLEDFLRIFRKGGAERALIQMHDLGVDQIVMPEFLALARPGDFELERKVLRSLDLATAKGTEFSNATILALVYYPFVRRALDRPEGESADLGGYAAIDRLASSFEQRLIVPKRDRDRIRLILLAQKRLAGGARAGRKGSPSGFVRKPFFPEAFDLFDIISSATGEHRDEVRHWKSRISSTAAATDGPSLGPPMPSAPGRQTVRHEEGRGGRGRRAGQGRGQGESGRSRGAGAGGQHQRTPGGQPHRGAGGRSSQGPGSQTPRAPVEPLVIPELAPGENPYGDAIAVPLPPASSASSDAGRRRASVGDHTAPGGRSDRPRHGGRGSEQPAVEFEVGGAFERAPDPGGATAETDGAGLGPTPDGGMTGGGAGPQDQISGAGQGGRKRRRRRGGRGRRKSPGGLPGAGGVPAGGHQGSDGDLGVSDDDAGSPSNFDTED